ncbi:phosphotransferase enzyme [Aspergillus niger]|uniref:Grx4 family monothiol glutaredoxin n=1 Tax=Aspergillus niger TaxID=5061 RepID=A0A505ICC6_ASPNG|nr:Grx4 family monothiol glutaredoxin [Aspergillus niger]GLA48815.1 phosphotransferase enzyme [Aspergillus niger]
MDADEQRKAKALHRAQTLPDLYLLRWLKTNETVFQSLQSPNTLRHQVSVVPGLVLMDYEPLLNSLLRGVRKNWADIVGLGSDDSSHPIPCPLQSSMEEVQQQEEDGELLAQGVALMDTFISDTGFFKHWDGMVDEIDYERSRKELGRGMVRFLEREARNGDERREWLNALRLMD